LAQGVLPDGGVLPGRPIRQDHHDVAVVARRREDYVEIDEFDPHWFRHSSATRLLRRATPIEVVCAARRRP
jgi:hypothetical protein